MVDTSKLSAALAALTTQVAETTGTEASALALINGFSQAVQTAVTKALEADKAANQGSIDAATEAILDVTAQFNNSAKALGDAVAANNPQAPAPEAPPSDLPANPPSV